MEFSDILARRRMTRSYTDEPVDHDVLARIAASVLKAPSGGFSQGHHVVVVTDEEIRRHIAVLAGEEQYVVASGFAPWISQAPAHFVLCMREESYHERYREPDKLQEDGTEMEWPVPWWWVDAGAAMMLLLLAAIDEGLGAGVFGLFPAEHNEELRVLLGMPADLAVVGVVTVGHPAPDPTRDRLREALRRRRKPAEQVVRWERW
jgi:FMN reductase [NAD(P)H]